MWTLIFGWHMLPFELLAGAGVLMAWSTAARALVSIVQCPLGSGELSPRDNVACWLAWAIGITLVLGIAPLLIAIGWNAAQREGAIPIAIVLLLGSPVLGGLAALLGCFIVSWCYWVVDYHPE